HRRRIRFAQVERHAEQLESLLEHTAALDGDGADIDDVAVDHFTRRAAAEVVDEAEPRIAQLARAGAAVELQIDLIQHADAAGADRVAKTFQAAVDLAGKTTFGVESAVEDIANRAAFVGQEQVLHRHQFG